MAERRGNYYRLGRPGKTLWRKQHLGTKPMVAGKNLVRQSHLLWTSYLCPPPNSYLEILDLNVTELGGGAFERS